MDGSDLRLFVGIGSPHGDDQAGWLVADRLGESVSSLERRSRSPRCRPHGSPRLARRSRTFARLRCLPQRGPGRDAAPLGLAGRPHRSGLRRNWSFLFGHSGTVAVDGKSRLWARPNAASQRAAWTASAQSNDLGHRGTGRFGPNEGCRPRLRRHLCRSSASCRRTLRPARRKLRLESFAARASSGLTLLAPFTCRRRRGERRPHLPAWWC